MIIWFFAYFQTGGSVDASSGRLITVCSGKTGVTDILFNGFPIALLVSAIFAAIRRGR
ncbi:MAG: hypothetical protein ACLUDU_04540 [Butyricimonas faecihominis]